MTTAETTADPWKKLLAISTSVTEPGQSFDLQSPSDDDSKKLKSEDMEFLELAMRSTMGENQGPCLFTQFFLLGGEPPEKLVNSPPKLAAAKELADQLEDYLILGNFADQFVSERGLEAIANLTLAKNEEIQLLYLRLIPQIAENRPEFQKAIAESEVFQRYVELLKDYETVKTHIFLSVLSAISSIVRSSPEAWTKFYDANGVELLKLVVQNATNNKVAGRAAYLLYSIHFTFAEPLIGDRQRYKHENEDCGGEEWSDEEEMYATVLKERSAVAAGGEKARRILEKSSSSHPLPNRLDKDEAKEDKAKRDASEKKLPHEKELVNALLLVYTYLKKRIAYLVHEKEVFVCDFDESTLDFHKDTLVKIQALLLNASFAHMTDDTKTEMSDFFKKYNRDRRLEHQQIHNEKLIVEMDPVAKRFMIPQFFSKKEIVEMKDVQAKKTEAAEEDARKNLEKLEKKCEEERDSIMKKRKPEADEQLAKAGKEDAEFMAQEKILAEQRLQKEANWEKLLEDQAKDMKAFKKEEEARTGHPSTSSAAAGPSTPTQPAGSMGTRKTPGRNAKNKN